MNKCIKVFRLGYTAYYDMDNGQKLPNVIRTVGTEVGGPWIYSCRRDIINWALRCNLPYIELKEVPHWLPQNPFSSQVSIGLKMASKF